MQFQRLRAVGARTTFQLDICTGNGGRPAGWGGARTPFPGLREIIDPGMANENTCIVMKIALGICREKPWNCATEPRYYTLASNKSHRSILH